MGFQQNLERLSFEETAFSIYIQLVKHHDIWQTPSQSQCFTQAGQETFLREASCVSGNPSGTWLLCSLDPVGQAWPMAGSMKAPVKEVGYLVTSLYIHQEKIVWWEIRIWEDIEVKSQKY